MRSKTAFKTIREFLFQENKTFVIPNYQRGYKWAVKENSKNSTVETLMDNLINADKNQFYFLQGITVTISEKDNKIVLIDGQQRATTLYLLLWCLSSENINGIDLVYDIRQQSKEFIRKLKEVGFDYTTFDIEEESQDVFYFKKAIEQINGKLSGVDKEIFYEFLLDNVKILYIIIDADKATNTFTMMNGNKATMILEELIKAEMLRKVSYPENKQKQVSTSVDDNLINLKEIITHDWETNAMRSRYAREWDKWLYWWNQKDVKAFFEVENPMGLLLHYFNWIKSNSQKIKVKFSFDDFRRLLKENGHTEKQKTQLIFKELRDMQKSFEDIFNRPKIHNYLKLSLICSNGTIEDKFNIIGHFMEKKNIVAIDDDYAKWRLVGATHLEITNPQKSKSEHTKEDRAQNVLELLSQRYIYLDENDLDFNDGRKEMAFRQLLRLNVEMDNDFNRKFDFSILNNRSLEHIYPKSKRSDLNWTDKTSIHCIGNLVLLYGSNNSTFGAKSVPDKKKCYFDFKVKFESRHLLHTISVFATDTWGVNEIEENQNKFFNKFQNDYNVTTKNL